MKQALLDKEQRRGRSNDLPANSEDLVLQAGRGENKSFRFYHLFNCGRKGHFAHNCPNSKSTNWHHHAKKAEKQEDSVDNNFI